MKRRTKWLIGSLAAIIMIALMAVAAMRTHTSDLPDFSFADHVDGYYYFVGASTCQHEDIYTCQPMSVPDFLRKFAEHRHAMTADQSVVAGDAATAEDETNITLFDTKHAEMIEYERGQAGEPSKIIFNRPVTGIEVWYARLMISIHPPKKAVT